MKTRKTKEGTRRAGFKGELVPDKDPMDYETTGRYLRKNPYKTPPNNLTTKDE